MSCRSIALPRIESAKPSQFEHLSRAGEALNLEEYFSTPEDLRMAYSILKNANCPPAEVELLKEISRLKEALAGAEDETLRQPLQHALAQRQTELAIMLERWRKRART